MFWLRNKKKTLVSLWLELLTALDESQTSIIILDMCMHVKQCFNLYMGLFVSKPDFVAG